MALGWFWHRSVAHMTLTMRKAANTAVRFAPVAGALPAYLGSLLTTRRWRAGLSMYQEGLRARAPDRFCESIVGHPGVTRAIDPYERP